VHTLIDLARGSGLATIANGADEPARRSSRMGLHYLQGAWSAWRRASSVLDVRRAAKSESGAIASSLRQPDADASVLRRPIVRRGPSRCSNSPCIRLIRLKVSSFVIRSHHQFAPGVKVPRALVLVSGRIGTLQVARKGAALPARDDSRRQSHRGALTLQFDPLACPRAHKGH